MKTFRSTTVLTDMIFFGKTNIDIIVGAEPAGGVAAN